MKYKIILSFSLLIILSSALALSFVPSHKNLTLPSELKELVDYFPSLPRYVEAGYSPLGRSPVVDAALNDPFYLPSYGKQVAEALKPATKKKNSFDIATLAFTAGAIPLKEIQAEHTMDAVPQNFIDSFGSTLGSALFKQAKHFIKISKETRLIFASLSEDEKNWLRNNFNAFFFGAQQKDDEYEFFTTNSPMPLKFFELASRIDLAELADKGRELCQISDALYLVKEELASLSLKEDFLWSEDEIKFFVSTKTKTTHTESYDFFIDCGGSNTLYSSAGGTLGTMSAALHIDVKGHNFYRAENFAQGAGFLGVGLLANFSGKNSYKASSFSQAAALFGCGIMVNYEGDNQFEVDFGGQSMALFGSSLLWNIQGHNNYLAHEGLAQSASSTLGVAFLIENEGDNNYTSGVKGKGGSRYGGMGQGGSIGTRSYPWVGHASFYGGLSFLYVQGGYNHFYTPWIGQGSAYFLGLGVLVAEGDYNQFEGDYDLQGQGLHLASGLLLHRGGKSNFKGGWGSLGVGGDRATGFFISTKGSNYYEGTDQSIGTSRKPKAIGVFIDLEGNNHYQFKQTSNANIQLPQMPDEWSTALFLELGPGNSYPQDVDQMKRGSGLTWGVPDHSWGIDRNQPTSEAELFAEFPSTARLAFPFNPLEVSQENVAYKPLIKINNQANLISALQELKSANYDHRRQLYESIDLALFTQPSLKPDFSDLLKETAHLPEDLVNFILLWTTQHPHDDLKPVIEVLMQKTILSAYSRKMAIYAAGSLRDPQLQPLFVSLIEEDSEPENRTIATIQLMKITDNSSFALLKQVSQNPTDSVRYTLAQRLRESKLPFALEILNPLLDDESFYVKRAAAISALSLHEKKGIDVLLDTIHIETLDTTDNYGDNLFNDLAEYVGVNFGLDKEAWLAWWKQERDHFQFPNKTQSDDENLKKAA